MKVDDKDVYSVRETTGKILFASVDASKLVEFYKSLGV